MINNRTELFPKKPKGEYDMEESTSNHFELFDISFLEKKGIKIKYILFNCLECNRIWGCTPDEFQRIAKKDLVCRECAVKKIAQETK